MAVAPQPPDHGDDPERQLLLRAIDDAIERDRQERGQHQQARDAGRKDQAYAREREMAQSQRKRDERQRLELDRRQDLIEEAQRRQEERRWQEQRARENRRRRIDEMEQNRKYLLDKAEQERELFDKKRDEEKDLFAEKREQERIDRIVRGYAQQQRREDAYADEMHRETLVTDKIVERMAPQTREDLIRAERIADEYQYIERIVERGHVNRGEVERYHDAHPPKLGPGADDALGRLDITREQAESKLLQLRKDLMIAPSFEEYVRRYEGMTSDQIAEYQKRETDAFTTWLKDPAQGRAMIDDMHTSMAMARQNGAAAFRRNVIETERRYNLSPRQDERPFDERRWHNFAAPVEPERPRQSQVEAQNQPIVERQEEEADRQDQVGPQAKSRQSEEAEAVRRWQEEEERQRQEEEERQRQAQHMSVSRVMGF